MASEASYDTVWVDKSSLKIPKMVHFSKVFWSIQKAYGQTVLPDDFGVKIQIIFKH